MIPSNKKSFSGKSKRRSTADAQAAAPKYRLMSGALALDSSRWILSMKKRHSRKNKSPWHIIDIGGAWLPPSPVNPKSIQLRERPDLCWMIVATIDGYLVRQKTSKSGHIVASDIARYLCKLCEYAWLQGFYRPQDMPKEAWEPLRQSLVVGGWVQALQVERRTLDLLRQEPQLAKIHLRPRHDTSKGLCVRTEFLERLGTNIAGRELAWVRTLLVQALSHSRNAEVGEVPSFQFLPKQPASQTMLLQILRYLNMLADVDPPVGLAYLPTADANAYAMKHGRPGGRTENISPQVGAELMKNAFKWIFDIGPAVVDLVEITAVQLAPVYGKEFALSYAGDPNSEANLRACRSAIGRRLQACLPECKRVEALIGKKITSYTRLTPRPQETSLYAVLNQLYTACFIVLAAMNARRRDEVSHEAIGLHMNCIRWIDEELKLVQGEFYIEKTIKDYDWFYINEVSLAALEILRSISAVAWNWLEYANGEPTPTDRDMKLFCYPAFASPHKGKVIWFDFNANPRGMANEFLTIALGELRIDFVIAPHMFRRLYGLIYHYRYEDATLVGLARKYRHFDITSVLRYVTNGIETRVGSHAMAMWSSPAGTVGRQEQEQKMIWNEVNAVGIEKLFAFVEDVVSGVTQFGGGFARLVSRFHRKLSGHIDYKELDQARKAKTLAKVFKARGHMPQPYRHATCMAGENRKSSACSENGHLARENASPVVCTGCPYSVVKAPHVRAMEADAEVLKTQVEGAKGPLATASAEREWKNLVRVIQLNKQRLGSEI